MDRIRYPEHLVFGLDIGTRSIIGTVGYKLNKDNFIVVAQVMKEHETRAMMDGQIHDIAKVSETITIIKQELEAIVGETLSAVCIAAAGRVLKTIMVKADHEFTNETVVNEEHVRSLNMLGVEKAYDIIRESKKRDHIKFYCVGYTVVRYYMNDYAITTLEGHKAEKISTELLATFLPEDVIDGLYASVEKAGLYVSNLTLEPIAAINVAIPDKFRLLNIALVDVGAGTSDICITKDGSIIAYGMIPFAGDEITEEIATHYLVDFNTAEKIKMACLRRKSVSYKDIMGLGHKVATTEVLELVTVIINQITKSISDKIIELNGNKPVSAVFIVGGGGKIPNFTDSLSEYLGIAKERVALRGAEVLKNVEFLQDKIKKDSVLVTPIGICLSYYEEKNNFIFVSVNGERIKLYDNNKLTIVDAAIQIEFPNESLFPQRGKTLNFKVNGKQRFIRGEAGEAAIIKLNDNIVGISHSISQNDTIELITSTVGEDASFEIHQLPEYKGIIEFKFNGQNIICPRFVMLNHELVSEFYSIKENDNIQILDYYTLKQVLEFMDVDIVGDFYVNNVLAGLDEKIYDKFSISHEMKNEEIPLMKKKEEVSAVSSKNTKKITKGIQVMVNGESVLLSGKETYILVDVFDFYFFDLTVAKGNKLITTINGVLADFTQKIQGNDVIAMYWGE